MIPIHHGNVVTLVPERTRVADLIKNGQRIIWRRPAARRTESDAAMTVEQARNARREADYVARRNGIKEPLLQIWNVQ